MPMVFLMATEESLSQCLSDALFLAGVRRFDGELIKQKIEMRIAFLAVPSMLCQKLYLCSVNESDSLMCS